eukprot:scaffold18729_cov66-Phaeocystis_antarctica.AAC.4
MSRQCPGSRPCSMPCSPGPRGRRSRRSSRPRRCGLALAWAARRAGRRGALRLTPWPVHWRSGLLMSDQQSRGEHGISGSADRWVPSSSGGQLQRW